MFSNLIKREITKLMLVVFLYTNLSPAFCGLTPPAYIVNVAKIDMFDEDTKKVAPALMVKAERLITQTIANSETPVYQTIFEQVVTPFMMMACDYQMQNNLARLTEVLQKVKATVETVKEVQQATEIIDGQNSDDLETKKSEVPETNEQQIELEKKEIETDVSHGFSLDIEGLGTLLISHDGDIILSAN